jgi:hypothetical protein
MLLALPSTRQNLRPTSSIKSAEPVVRQPECDVEIAVACRLNVPNPSGVCCDRQWSALRPNAVDWSGLHRTLVRMAQTRSFVGCCGWSEAQARYVVDFPAIELETTFYQAIAVVKRWKSQAPPGFRFCLKAWHADADSTAAGFFMYIPNFAPDSVRRSPA